MEMNILRFFICFTCFTVFLVSSIGSTGSSPELPADESRIDSPIWTRLFILDSVRKRVDFVGSVEVNYPAPRGKEIRLNSLELLYGEKVFVEMPLSIVLMGDGGWYLELTRNLEKLPPEISYLYVQRKYYPVDHHERLSLEERERIHDDVLERIDAARVDPYFALYPPTELIKFDIRLTEMVDEVDFGTGLAIPLTVRIRYEESGKAGVLVLNHTIDIVEPFPGGPDGMNLEGSGNETRVQANWYYGDLHVHDCKDEASIIGERGCPTCYAESLNWGDDNSLGEMKNQYEAMGANWFTITSHSYCVTSEFEYNNVVNEANSLSGPDFSVIPDTELQSEEYGPQEGSDEGDLICWNGVNHMGAHWITSFKAGGQDGLLEFCNEPITDFLSNIRDIRAEGGFGIINHPTGSSWGWNSYVSTRGFTHPDGMRGVEIWNGPFRSGQGGAVEWWVRKLLDGDPMYAYSGSDTHDDVFDFGWNHVYITGGFSKDKLKDALLRGNLYISNYQTLVVVIRDLSTERRALMGGGFPINSDADVEIQIYYNFGTKTGNILLYKGVVGDTGETLFEQENGLTGSGWHYVTDTDPAPAGLVYYRAYSTVTSGGDYSAYTNPVYVRVIPAAR
jgi:hypothetical protein